MMSWKSNLSPEELHTVLIVSDDTEMVSVWETLFQQKNCHVFSESSVKNALQTSCLLLPTLIVVDISLPSGEKLEFCRDLRATTDGTILLLAPKQNERELSNYRYAGVDEFISTPISPMALLIKSMAWLVRQDWALPRSQYSSIYS